MRGGQTRRDALIWRCRVTPRRTHEPRLSTRVDRHVGSPQHSDHQRAQVCPTEGRGADAGGSGLRRSRSLASPSLGSLEVGRWRRCAAFSSRIARVEDYSKGLTGRVSPQAHSTVTALTSPATACQRADKPRGTVLPILLPTKPVTAADSRQRCVTFLGHWERCLCCWKRQGGIRGDQQ